MSTTTTENPFYINSGVGGVANAGYAPVLRPPSEPSYIIADNSASSLSGYHMTQSLEWISHDAVSFGTVHVRNERLRRCCSDDATLSTRALSASSGERMVRTRLYASRQPFQLRVALSVFLPTVQRHESYRCGMDSLQFSRLWPRLSLHKRFSCHFHVPSSRSSSHRLALSTIRETPASSTSYPTIS